MQFCAELYLIIRQMFMMVSYYRFCIVHIPTVLLSNHTKVLIIKNSVFEDSDETACVRVYRAAF